VIGGTATIFAQIEQQRRLYESLSAPSLMQEMIDRHQRLTQPSAVQMLMEQRERWERLAQGPTEPSVIESIIAQKANIDRLVSPPIFEQLTRQQRLFEELVDGPKVWRMLAGWSGAMPLGLLREAEQYRHALRGEVAVEDSEIDADENFLSRLAAEREAILTCLDRVGRSMIAAGLLGVPIPDVVLGLIMVFIISGEVADEILNERERADDAA
jgi:hypothetical protein